MLEDYKNALKSGQRAYRACVARGQSPYLAVLDDILVNVNIVDKDQILAANEDPSAYPNLIVRVTGFTAYFSALSPEFRQLVVDRIISL